MTNTMATIVLATCVALAGNVHGAVKVFVLAGQSNMEGKAKISLLEYQANQPDRFPEVRALRDERGDWIVRDDVWIKFLDRKGPLTVGFGSPHCIGPELGFGQVVGDHYQEPVLIIKTAWGGKSLYRDFRPPSSGLPAEPVLNDLLQRARKRRPETTLADIRDSFGHYYREMLAEVRQTRRNLPELFPALADEPIQLAGFVWFQGWNDMVDPIATAEYTQNLANLIRDVRRDLPAAASLGPSSASSTAAGKTLPVVVGQLGVGGTKEDPPNAKKDRFKAAQAAVAELDGFRGNVIVVRTDQFWDEQADAIFKKGWRKHLQQWNQVGSDYPYHYLGSGRTYLRIGRAFGQAIIQLQRTESH